MEQDVPNEEDTSTTNGIQDSIKGVTETSPYKHLRDQCIAELSTIKFKMKDILMVSKSSYDQQTPKNLKEKILNIISKFIMLDRSPYSMSLELPDNQQASNDNTAPNHNDENGQESDLFSMLVESSDNSQQERQNSLHPSDVMVLLMNCCDTFVRQIIIQKIMTCQLAIPLILPDLMNDKHMFLLWAMRHLNLNWKTKLDGAQEGTPVTVGIPIVSAIRLGKFSNSKSKILNEIICSQSHDIFFHKDCDGGQLDRIFSNGVVELAWHLPAGKEKDNFEDIWTLANLRGDAKSHKMQFNLLKEVSSAMLVFLSLECIADNDVHPIIEMLSKSKQPLIFVFLNPVRPISLQEKRDNFNMFSKLMDKKGYSFVAESANGKESNASKLKINIRNKINKALLHIKSMENLNPLTLEDVSWRTDSKEISIDENINSCQIGKVLANDIMKKLMKEKPQDRKRKILPLQRKFNSWSENVKKLKRMEGIDKNNIGSSLNRIHNEIQQCRKDQLDKVQNMTPFMKEFINILIETEDKEVKRFFLQWMKLYLDVESIKHLPGQENKYHALWNKESKDVNDTKKLRELEVMLDELSFGLEHILREIGQVYEAIKEGVKGDNTQKKIREKELELLADNLSNFAAELLIDGYPLEIMDGDASHLPLTWVKAIFDSLKNKLNDKRVYVISVLGIQSSGKSTLLNTMFGLNFSVSAGRCTKGVFAQLISIDERLHSDLGYEYILVLDTEGLRAMELANIKLKHDNELASFIIGMGAVTIVNNKGENTAEIGDILQICVHAFLRMRLANKSINLQPGCYFAHQNVPDVNAGNKMLYGYKKLKDQLDKIATAAAEHENVSEITSFSDVIEFDVNKQIRHFPNLWIGDPPMAPANPGYSETVLKLKIDLLNYPDTNSSLTFSKLQERMTDLWKAILNENFVFSFKNSLEVRSYSLLEEKILMVSKEFHKKVKDKMHGYIITVNTCESDFNSLKQRLSEELTKFINECSSKAKEDLDNFFQTTADKDIINQWQSFATVKVDQIAAKLTTADLIKIETAIDLRKANYENLKQLEKYEDDIKEFVKKVVTAELAPAGSLDDMFEKEWEKFMKKLSFPKIKVKKDIKDEVWRFILEMYEKNHRIRTILEKHRDTDKLKIHNSDFEMTEFHRKYFIGKNVYPHESMVIQNEISNFTKEIEKKILGTVKEIVGQDYDEHFLWKIKNVFDEEVRIFNNKHDSKYKLSKEYGVKVFTYNLLKTIPHFDKIQKKFREDNDQKSMLNKNYKQDIYTIFICTHSRYNKEKTAAMTFGNKIKDAIIASMNDCLPQKLYEELTIYSDKHEFKTKNNLIKQVLKDLKKKGDFDLYTRYILNTKEALELMIEKYVTTYCTQKENASNKCMLGAKASEIFNEKVELLKKCIKDVTVNDKITFQTWRNDFKEAAKNIIPIDYTSLKIYDMEEVEVADIENFKKEISENLTKIKTQQEGIFNTWGIIQYKKLKEEPHAMISKDLLGCMAQCPLCNVVCKYTNDHTGPGKPHRSDHHYPAGIAGFRDDESDELDIECCTENVCGDGEFICPETNGKYVLYNNYRNVNENFRSWEIDPDLTIQSTAYWKSVFGKFSTEFAEFYNAKCNEIPPGWKHLRDENFE